MHDCKMQNWIAKCWSTDCHQRISSEFKAFLSRVAKALSSLQDTVCIDFTRLSCLLTHRTCTTETAWCTPPTTRKHCVSSPQNWRSWYWESQTGQNSPVWEHKHNQFLYLQWEECTLGPISVVIHHLPSNPSHSLPFLFTRESAARGRYHPQEHFKSSNQFSCKGSAPMWHIRALVLITYVFYPFTEQPGCSINCLLHREGTHGAGTGREHTQCPAHASCCLCSRQCSFIMN